MGLLNGRDVKIQEAKEFLGKIEKNQSIVKLWGDVHEYDPKEVRETALKFAQEDCDRSNFKCRFCDTEKGSAPSHELHDTTQDQLVQMFMQADSLDAIKKGKKKRKVLELFLREFTRTDDGYIWNECPKCGKRWAYELPERHLASYFRYKTSTEKLSEDIFRFIDYLNRYTINPTLPLYASLDATWPEDAIYELRHYSAHVCIIPLQVIYFYARQQHDKFEKPEQIFDMQDLSQPMSEYYGRFRPELEEVLVNRFGIKEII